MFYISAVCNSCDDQKVCKGHHSNMVVLVTCPLTSIIQDHVKEGKSLDLDCAAIKCCLHN